MMDFICSEKSVTAKHSVRWWSLAKSRSNSYWKDVL